MEITLDVDVPTIKVVNGLDKTIVVKNEKGMVVLTLVPGENQND